MIVVPVGAQISANYALNDHSQDTIINNFYANVWENLPTNSTLLTQSSVSGYSAFYWQLIHNIRQDVDVPALSNSNPQVNMITSIPLYSVVQPGTNAGVGALPRAFLPAGEWDIPVLYGESNQAASKRDQWILYKVQSQLPIGVL